MKTLYKIEYEGAYSNLALKEALHKAELSEVDKGFVTALVYGTIQRKITLDFYISQFSKIKLKKISKYILLILELGIYQLLFTDKVPQSAAVNESVKLAKRYGHASSAGYVNGILRSVVRCGGNLPEPKTEREKLCIKYSFPMQLAEKWIAEFGAEFADGLMQAMNEPAPYTLRVNTLKTTAEEMLRAFPESCRGRYLAEAIYCRGFDAAKSAEYKNGFVTVQDEAAMLAARVLAPKPGEVVMDMCAAPGGKTTHMAQLMENKGKILAFDIHEHKIALIEENAKRMGTGIISARCADASLFLSEYKNSADKILADVPCSGLGIIRRKPDIKLNRESIDELPKIQYNILKNAAGYLKCGGELVYSTCTIEKDENEAVIERFLDNNRDFERVDITELLPEKLRKETARKGYITLYPNVDGTDGFFIAKVKRVKSSD